MKRLNKTHIFHIFFGILMFLPFISILSRVIYVQSNKNAKDSYSGNYEITYKYKSNQINDYDDLVIGNIYEYKFEGNKITSELSYDESICFLLLSDIEIDTQYQIIDESLNFSKISSNQYVEFYHDYYENVSTGYIRLYTSIEDYNNGFYVVAFKYNVPLTNNFIGQCIDNNTQAVIYIYDYTDYNEIESVNLTGTLDNAFDYSISKFIEDNSFRINFFSWFEDLFLTQSGGVNALYLSFANWYMCYALLVSTGYLLFLILMWFINYVRKILEGGNSFGHGGF